MKCHQIFCTRCIGDQAVQAWFKTEHWGVLFKIGAGGQTTAGTKGWKWFCFLMTGKDVALILTDCKSFKYSTEPRLNTVYLLPFFTHIGGVSPNLNLLWQFKPCLLAPCCKVLQVQAGFCPDAGGGRSPLLLEPPDLQQAAFHWVTSPASYSFFPLSAIRHSFHRSLSVQELTKHWANSSEFGCLL